jgi:hypothetical protein
VKYWTCTCNAVNSDGRKACAKCGGPKLVPRIKPDAKPGKPNRSRKMAESPTIPERRWPVVDQKGLEIARRFGVEKREDHDQ